MNVEIKLSKNLENLISGKADPEKEIERGLMQSALLIQNTAKSNAPYDTGNLRRSISSDFGNIERGLVKIGSDVKYSNLREHVNNKNPHRKYYFKRAKDENENEIINIMDQALKNIFG